MTQLDEKSIPGEKSYFITEMFSRIASKYDLLNNLMTFGLHNTWKEKMIKLALLEIDEPKTALDLCSGTGDLAILLKKFCPALKITCIDNCPEMLNLTQKKIETLGFDAVNLLYKNCETLDLPTHSFDLVTVGFGLRNLIDKKKVLQKIYSLLKPCGVFACIDLGFPVNPLWQKIYFFYFFKIIPKLGEIFAKDKGAYKYLTESLNSWYKQEELKDLILKTGFNRCYFKNILGGVVAIHIAVK